MVARLAVLALLAVALLAGCADEPVAPPPAAAPAAPSAPAASAVPDRAPAAGRAADAAYARMMIPHHEQALELAALVAGRSSSPEVADLAFRIDREQVEEVGQLQGLLRLWGEPVEGSAMPGMAGMAGPDVLARLRSASGPAFDRLWLDTMIAHHEGAVAMAREHLATGADAGLRNFSEGVVPAQQAEIGRMRSVMITP